MERLTTIDEGSNTRLMIIGEIEYDDASALTAAFETLFESNKKHIIVDFLKCSYIGSSGIGAIVKGLKDAQKMNGSVKLTHIPPDIENILSITRVLKHFEILE